MDTQTAKKTLSHRSSQSGLLASQAMSEMDRDGHVSVICPKCHTHPVITTTSRGERTTVRCRCGYIWTAEINF